MRREVALTSLELSSNAKPAPPKILKFYGYADGYGIPAHTRRIPIRIPTKIDKERVAYPFCSRLRVYSNITPQTRTSGYARILVPQNSL